MEVMRPILRRLIKVIRLIFRPLERGPYLSYTLNEANKACGGNEANI